MTKKLLVQIKNEWRNNLWLALELLVVSVVMWYVVDYLYTRAATYLEPRGFNIENCYLIELGELTPKSPDYIADRKSEDTHNDIAELVERLRRRPEVEAVSLSQNSYPYNGSNSSGEVKIDTLNSPGWTIRRMVTPDFVRVFRYQGAQGETPEQMAEMLERGEILTSNNLYSKYNRKMTEFIGQRFQLFGDTTRTYRLGAALQNVRYHDYDQARNSYCFLCKQSFYYVGLELCVRVREGQDHDFIQRLKADSEAQFRVGNLFISEIRSFHDIRRNFQQAWTNDIRNYVMGMGFLLLNIFLGLLGTFWFRTQQRRSEIALHKAHGATDSAIFSRLLSEGLLLLAVVTPIALVIDWNLAHMELNSWRNNTTPEAVTLVSSAGKVRASVPAGSKATADMVQTDEAFWSVFSFRFLSGAGFTRADCDAGLPRAVLSATIARQLFGTTDVVGHTVQLNYIDYTVAGVVADVSMLATAAYAQIWVPYTAADAESLSWQDDTMGPMHAVILAHSSADFDAIRKETELLRQKYNDGLRDVEIFYRGQPDTQLAYLYRRWYAEPDVPGVMLRYGIVIAILLLVPAVNLSGMTLSRMRRRMAEIGVRKAFGATGGELIRQVFFENFVLTLLAGVVGLALSYAATFLLNDFLFSNSTNAYLSGETALTPGMLLSPWAFIAAFAFCLLMNVLSAGIPAWRASRMNITDAINQR